MKQVTTNMAAFAKKYLNALNHNGTQKQLLRHCKYITKFLFWVLWTYLANSIKNNNVNLFNLVIPNLFLVYSFLRYCKLVTLSTFRMPDHAH